MLLNMLPEISIIMPAFNVEKYIEQAITSVLKQTFSEWELIIVDDGSTDKTWEIISSFSDPRIHSYHFNSNKGAGWASKFALQNVNSEFVARMDADDTCSPYRFEKQYQFLIDNPEVDIVRTYAKVFSESSEIKNTDFYKRKIEITEKRSNQALTREEIKERLYWYPCMITATALMRTEPVKRIGYSDDFRMGEDYHLLYNLNKNNCVFDTIAEYLYNYRVVSGSATDKHKSEHSRVNYAIKKKEISNLFIKSQVYIWGTGGQAQELTELLASDNLQISGYIDFNRKESCAEWNILDINRLNPVKHKVIIAATPVREKAVHELYSRGFQHIKDFIVLQ